MKAQKDNEKKKEKLLKKNVKLFNKWARTYDFPIFQFWMKRFHKPVLQKINFSKKQKIIDLSCGTGELLYEMARRDRAGSEFYGIDISQEMLKVAGRKIPSAKLKLADVHALPFEGNMFDMVISTEAFHHYYEQQKALAEMSRVAKKGGMVMVIDINFFFEFFHFLFKKIEPGCVKVNSKLEMRKLFEKSGLQNIRQKRNFLFSVMTAGIKS